MVRGVDVWLNNPQRPREASGTSGMKLVPNGGLNCSILDGWWAEAYDPEVGWAIGGGEDYEPDRDPIEANALYDVLENQVIPAFYDDRDSRGVPRRWVRMMKTGMIRLAARFSTDRMVRQYVDEYYLPAAEHFTERVNGDLETTHAIAAWKRKVSMHWPEVRIAQVQGAGRATRVGEEFEVQADVRLGHLAPDDVQVQVYHGPVDALARLVDASATPMERQGERDGSYRYAARVRIDRTGRHGFTVRVVPHHPKVLVPNEVTEIRWAT